MLEMLQINKSQKVTIVENQRGTMPLCGTCHLLKPHIIRVQLLGMNHASNLSSISNEKEILC
jgi:hypothetical protein